MKTENQITLEQARRVLEVVDAGLSEGVGEPIPGQMCVEAAVCYALGQPHGDEPKCVAEFVRRFKITLNDKGWSSNEARAKGMRRIAIAQLGSAELSNEQIDLFSVKLCELTIRRIVPIAMRAAASMKGNADHKEKLEACAMKCETDGTRDSAIEAKNAADNAYAYAAYAAADYAANYTDYAAEAADYAAEAADYAAEAADYAKQLTRDQILTICAECGIEALRAAGSPGIALMDQLCPL